MKKIVFLMVMMLAIAGVVAQGVNFTVNKDLKKSYYMAKINITSGTAPFDIVLNGRHLDQYHLYCQYDVNNIITITDANNTSKTDTIYEFDPHFSWGTGYFEYEFTDDMSGISIRKTGVSIRCPFRDRYNFEMKWYRTSDYSQIGSAVYYEPVPDSIWTCLVYQIDQAPIGTYAVSIRDTVHNMDTLVFVEITNSGDTTTTDTTGVDTTTTDTTTTDTTATDTTQHLNVTITQVDEVEFYPNPTISYCNTSELLHEVYVLDNVGRRLRKFTHTNKIDLSGLPTGSYLIRYTTLNGTTNTKKIIKE